MEREILEIFERITEKYQVPIRVGSRCEANIYYRVDDLSPEDIEFLARYIAERIRKVCSAGYPEALINLPGSYSGLASMLAVELGEPERPLEVIDADKVTSMNGNSARLKNLPVILVNDVITTARSCLEAHTKITCTGAQIMCWAALVDRTFGPGPVPVVASYTGAPVTLLE